jgi:branched-chain amino acid transport system permease protein
MQSDIRSKAAFVALAFLALALYPLVAGNFGVDLVTKIMIYAIFALSLELLVGGTGLVCFGHAAFFGIGAYATVLLSPESDPGSVVLLIGASVLAAGLYALAVGALSLRTKGVYFIMVTLAFAQMAYYVVHDTPLGGGTDGIYLNVKPVAGPLDLDGAVTMYFFTLAVLVAVFGLLALISRSRFGRALAGIRVNEQRMRATGFATYPYKLAAFTISGALAGLAGFLFAVKDGFVNPEMMSWHLSGSVLIMIILGGIGHLRGALIGLRLRAAAGVLQVGSDLRRLRQALAPGPGPDHHRQRGPAAARVGGCARPVEGTPGGPLVAPRRNLGGSRWQRLTPPPLAATCCCAVGTSPGAGAAWWP